MEYRYLGRTGLQVSAIGLGTNQFGGKVDAKGTEVIVKQALDLGITFIDTATVYSQGRSEEYIGRAIKGQRDKVILTTKFGLPMGQGPNRTGGSRHHVIGEVEASLKRLGTDYIDLYLLHQPDPHTPIEETLRALDDLVRVGKVRYTGCSNIAAWRVSEALWTSRSLGLHAFSCVQLPYNLIDRDVEREVLPLCQAYGLALAPYYPLAGGFLTGKYRKGQPSPEGARLSAPGRLRDRLYTEANLMLIERLEHFAQERGHTVGDLAVAWLLANPLVPSVIAGATRPDQVATNAAPAGWKLSRDELAEIEKLCSAGV